MSRGHVDRGIWKAATAWLLSLALSLGFVGDLAAGLPSLSGPAELAGEICHSPGTGQPGDSGAAPRASHDCCIVCHAAQGHSLVPPSLGIIGPAAPAMPVVFTPSAAAPPSDRSSFHHRARAPPSA